MQNNITGLLLDLDELDFAVILRKLKDFFVKWLERAEHAHSLRPRTRRGHADKKDARNAEARGMSSSY